MIRYLTAAFILAATPAMAQAQGDAPSTRGFVHAAFARIYCGLAIPDALEKELGRVALRNGWDRLEYATAIVLLASKRGQNMTEREKEAICAKTLRAYRELGLQR